MSVVLIYPFRRITHAGAGAPMGLLYLATYLRNHDFQSTIVDFAGEEASDEQVIEDIIKEKPDIVGLPLYSVGMKRVYDLVSLLRKHKFSGKIVLGAQHATALPEETMSVYSEVDYLITNEAEIPLLKLADYITNGTGQLNDIENLYYRNVNIKHTADVPDINNDLDSLPFPDRTILHKYYISGLYNRPYSKGSSDFLITSRGCPYKCNFCFPSAATYRYRSPESIVDELVYLNGLNRDHIEILDDSFTISKKRLADTLEIIIKQNLRMSFKIRSRVDAVDEGILDLMKRAGVKYIVYGIESGSDRMLQLMNKKTSVAENAEAIRLTKKAGIMCFTDLFVGYPGETEESINDTMNFLFKTKPTGIQMAVYYPFPKTKGYEEAKERGSLIGEWSHKSYEVPFIKLDFVDNRVELVRVVHEMRRKYYFSPAVFLQTVRFILLHAKISDFSRIIRYAQTRLKKIHL